MHVPKYVDQRYLILIFQGNLPVRLWQSTHRAACTFQDTGEDLWGLSRISQRHLNSYESARYKYAENDGKGVQVK